MIDYKITGGKGPVGKRKWTVSADSEGFTVCPRCDYRKIHTGNAGAWCAKCGLSYRPSRQWNRFVFDEELRNGGMARIVQQAGGLGTIGRTVPAKPGEEK